MRLRRATRSTWARIALAAGVALLFPAAPATAAGPPQQGSGEGRITGLVVTPIRNAGGNLHEERTLVGEVNGTLAGQFVQETAGTVHTNHPDNRVTFRGVLLFTGTIQGCGPEEHTLALGVSGRGTVPQPGFPITEASVRVIDDSGSTLEITGQGTVTQVGADLSYDVQYICW